MMMESSEKKLCLSSRALCALVLLLQGPVALVQSADHSKLEIFQGAGRCTGDDTSQSIGVRDLPFGSCLNEMGSYIRADCVVGGSVRISFFKTEKGCQEAARGEEQPVLAPLVGKSGECFLISSTGPVQATFSWEVSEACPEGPIPMRFSEKCEEAFYAQAGNTKGFDAASGFGPRLQECRRLCDEAWFKGGVNFPEFEENCTCPVDYANKLDGMRACEAAGGKSCFENIALTNGKGAKISVTGATFDCIPEECMDQKDFGIYEQKKVANCQSLPGGATGCKVEIECLKATSTTTLPPPSPAPVEGDANIGAPRHRAPVGWAWAALALSLAYFFVTFSPFLASISRLRL